MVQKTPIEQLRLPPERIEAIKAAGIMYVEDLCTKQLLEVGKIVGPDLRVIKEVRVALGELGMDIRAHYEDPVGSPNIPSRKALRSLFDRLNLMPRTRVALMQYLLGGLFRREVLLRVEPEDREKIERLLELMVEDDR